MSNCTGPALAVRDPVAATRTRHVADRHCAFSASIRSGCFLGQTEADVGAHLGAEVAELLHRLVGAGAQQLVGPVGAQHDQRHPRVVGLDDGGPEVGHRGARRHRHTHRGPLGHREPDREVAGGALVDADVQPEPARAVGVVQGECQRRVARTRAQHDVAHAAANQFVDDNARLRSRWVHHYRLSAKNFRAAALTTCGLSMNRGARCRESPGSGRSEWRRRPRGRGARAAPRRRRSRSRAWVR